MELLSATESDSDRLKDFFVRMILPGTIDFSILRRGSFFDQYRIFSDDFETVMLKDEGEIVGMASLLFREGMVVGEKQTWAYATDLRIAPARKAIAQWAQKFLPALEDACARRNCKYIFSAVGLGDNQAYNALIRPTSHTRRKLPRYHLVNRFRIVALHGRTPFRSGPLTSIRLTAAGINDVEQLCAYYGERGQRRSLSRLHQPETFMNEIKRWKGLTLGDFRIARDAKGKILGCAALWDGRQVQQFSPQGYRGIAASAHQMLSLGRYLGLTRSSSEPHHPMPTRFLTHLSCDSGEVFHRLADEAFSRLAKNEFLSYLHFRGNWRTLPPKAFIATSLPYGLFLILPPTADAPSWHLGATPGLQHLPPEFEIAWL